MTDAPGMASNSEAETPVAWPNIAIGSAALVLALPALFGGLGSLIPALLHPDGKMPMVTGYDRTVISIFTWSSVLVLLSPPATLGAAILGVWASKRVGWKTAFSRTLLAVIGLAALLTAASYGLMWIAAQRHPRV